MTSGCPCGSAHRIIVQRGQRMVFGQVASLVCDGSGIFSPIVLAIDTMAARVQLMTLAVPVGDGLRNAARATRPRARFAVREDDDVD